MSSDVSTTSNRHHRLPIRDIIEDKRTRSVVLWVALILAAGTVFYHYAEEWSWIDSFYFSFISLATVGYGDLVPTTPLSKLFTVFYIANGLGMLVAFIDIYASYRLGRPIGDAEQLVN